MGRAAFIEWAGESAIELRTTRPGPGLDDLERLRAIVGDARVVALGENSHTLHQQHGVKHRVVEFLASEMGFTVLALEESPACCERVDTFVRGGAGDAASVVDQLSLYATWMTEEMVDLVRWMRAHNRGRPVAQRLRFEGVDIGSPGAGVEHAARVLGVGRAPGLGVFHDDDWQRSLRAYDGLTPAETVVLGADLGNLIEALTQLPRDAEVEWATRLAVVGMRAHEMFVAMAAGDWRAAINLRDEAMAEQLLMLARNGERIVLWSHNGHVSSTSRQVPDARWEGPITPVGSHVRDALGDELVVLGFTYDHGTDRSFATEIPIEPAHPGSLDGTLACVGKPRFIVDLRLAPEAARGWLSEERDVRYEATWERMRPAEAFDAVVFVDEVSPTHPRPAALARFPGGGAR